MDQAFRRFTRDKPCAACRFPTSQACHARSKGSGHFDWLSNGDGNLVNLCNSRGQWCHDKADGRHPFHGGRAEFEADTGLDLVELARRNGEEFKEAA